ncbi:MAG: OmpA family protein, partial [Pseudomonadota bacterium]
GGSQSNVSVHWSDELGGSLVRQFELQPGQEAIHHATFDGAADALAEDGGGLALLPLSEIGAGVPLVVTGACGRGTLGVGDAIRTGDYPLSEVVVLQYPTARQTPLARNLLKWLDGERAGIAIQRAGFVDLAVGPVIAAFDGRQEADPIALSFDGGTATEALRATLDDALRINVAMRFQDGSSLPDRTARLQISRLVSAIKSGEFDGQRIYFVGFSDADGAASTNLRLSERRAEAIRNEVEAAVTGLGGVTGFEAVGLGEAMPVACNGIDWGERLNRRVEVWAAPG